MEDLAAAYHWLVKEGIAQPDAVLLTGASYGGYNTLMGLGKLPDLWAGGMALVAGRLGTGGKASALDRSPVTYE